MNPKDRVELDTLKVQLRMLQEQLDQVRAALQRLEHELGSTRPDLTSSGPARSSPARITAAPNELPPIISEIAAAPASAPAAPIPSVEIASPVPLAQAAQPPALPTEVTTPLPTAGAAPSALAIEPASIDERETRASFEMRLGTYWLVRIGIVMVLTALVFFGRFAYEHYIGRLGPGGKIGLMYVASFALLGLGVWLPRKQEKLRNYAQVLAAGGLAAVYFTTYAAHYFDRLRIIHSPVLAGALLLAWAGFIIWLADRRKSEVLALFAVVLAYYTSAINRVELFTLFSNLVLTGAAIYFLLKNRWATVSFVSLVASYGAYAYWRLGSEPSWARLEPAQFWLTHSFLLGYWLIFSGAVFLSRAEPFLSQRVFYLTFNNAAFFGLVTLALSAVYPGKFWVFSLGFGAVLLGLSQLARSRLSEAAGVMNGYLTQGLVLVTVGLIARFSGLNLALLLAAESVVLWVLRGVTGNRWIEAGAFITAVLGTGTILWPANVNQVPWIGSVGVGAMLMFNAFWAHRQEAVPQPGWVRWRVTVFAALALLIWGVTLDRHVSAPNSVMILMLAGLALTGSCYLVLIPEVVYLAQLYWITAVWQWLARFTWDNRPDPWWIILALAGGCVILSHWWQRQKRIPLSPEIRRLFEGSLAIAAIGVLWLWSNLQFRGGPTAAPVALWIPVASGMALGITLYSTLTRAWLLAACGQLFLLTAIWNFLWVHLAIEPGSEHVGSYALAPIAVTLAEVIGLRIWLDRHPQVPSGLARGLRHTARVYVWIAAPLLLIWLHEYVPESELVWVQLVTSTMIFLLAGWRRDPELFGVSVLFAVAGLLTYLLLPALGARPYWPDLLGLLLSLGQQFAARARPARYPWPEWVHRTYLLAGSAGVWLFVSRWIADVSEGFFLTATWSLLALVLFLCGLGLRERMYRWIGLGILAIALGKVVLVDVWKLATIYRVVSFLALGIVLLVLGFFYNKYQDRLRRWL